MHCSCGKAPSITQYDFVEFIHDVSSGQNPFKNHDASLRNVKNIIAHSNMILQR